MYQKLKTKVLPHLKSFQTDLIAFDKKQLSKFKGSYLHGARSTGTNIVRFKLDDYNYHCDEKKFQKQLQHDRDFLLRIDNDLFHHYDGKELHQITREECEAKLNQFHENVKERYEHIHKLGIHAMAFELYFLMQDHKQWRKVLREQHFEKDQGASPALRRLRNHFNHVKLKTSNNVEEIESQLHELVNFEVNELVDRGNTMKLITINGIYKDTKEHFTADAAIGQWDGVSNDDHIFYWFDDYDMVIGEHPDFIITSYEALETESKPKYVAGQYYWVRYRLAVPEIMRVSQKANYIDLEFRTFDNCTYELDSSDISVLKKVEGFYNE